jgi:ABC-2 type transport system ATP-binding protein
MTCDRVAMIFAGRVRSVGPLSELLTTRLLSTEVAFRREQGELPPLPTGASTRLSPDARLVDLPEEADVDAFLLAAMHTGCSVLAVTPRRESLEDLFVREALAEKGAA